MVVFDVVMIPLYLTYEKDKLFSSNALLAMDIIGNLITFVFILDVFLGFR